MKHITINTAQPYKMLCGEGLLEQAASLLMQALQQAPHKNADFDRVVLVSDSNVQPLYAERCASSFRTCGKQVLSFVFPAGESSKNLSLLGELLEFLAAHQLSANDMLLALGGGVCGDLTGLAAAIYLRGIRYMQLPTTLLAAVDSSVGGKTAVNLSAGKNLVGAFHQPQLVLYDCSTFATLSPQLAAEGMAEVLKAGIIADANLFAQLEQGLPQDKLADIVAEAVSIKARIVEQDEFDRGTRRLLNLGHTAGHAIEKLSSFSIPHGQAVAIGLALISRAADKLRLSKQQIAPRIEAALKQNNLPTHCPYTAAELAQAALLDKKRSGGSIDLIMPLSVGECQIIATPVEQLEQIFAAGLAEQEAGAAR